VGRKELASPMPQNETELRAMIRDDRYWRVGHPDRAALHARVSEGYQALGAADGGSDSGAVHVRAHTRMIGNRPVQISAHTRANHPSADESNTVAPEAPSRVNETIEIDSHRDIVLASAGREAACWDQYERDSARCRIIPDVRDRNACWRSAASRNAQCGVGRPIPSLIIGS
jgi:hypothetical protein